MPNYKEMTTLVPSWAKWCAVDADGDICVFSEKPKATDNYGGIWEPPFGEMTSIGQGPSPEDWTQELYRLVDDD